MGIWRHEGKCALRGRERGIRSTEVVCVSLCKVFMRGEAMMEYLEREREKVLGFPPMSSALPDDPTDVTSDEGHYVHHQMQSTGNSFSVPVVAHVIRPWCTWVINGGELALHPGLPSIFEKHEVLSAILPTGSPAGVSRVNDCLWSLPVRAPAP